MVNGAKYVLEIEAEMHNTSDDAIKAFLMDAASSIKLAVEESPNVTAVAFPSATYVKSGDLTKDLSEI